MKTAIGIFAFYLIGQTAMAQCGPYKHHPVWPDTVGFAYVNLNECGNTITSCLWDNGSTDLQTDLVVGPHSIVFFAGTVPMDTTAFTIVQDHWDLHQQAIATFMGVELDIFGGVEPYGVPQIFNNPACLPVADSTVVYLLQDGIAIDSLTPVSPDIVEHMWNGLPYGHTYQTYVVDHSQCGSYGYEPVVTAYSSGTVEMMIDTQDAQGGNGGSITVSGVTVDPLSPLPPPTPFTGTFSLFEYPDHIPIGTEQAGTSATWENLPAGQYDVYFTPDSICNSSDTVVTIDLTTGIKEDRAAPMRVWPQPATDILHWSSIGNGTVSVHDAQGRLVLEGSDLGRLDVSRIPAGFYHLQITDGVRISWARFLKE